MVNITNVGQTVTPAPTDNNKRSPADAARVANQSDGIDPTKQPRFVDRRKNPDRRVQSKKPLLDTRRNKDRRRTGRLDVEI